MVVEGATFDICHGKDKGLLTRMLAMRVKFSQIKRGETSVKMEVQFFSITRLAVAQTRKLFRISKNELKEGNANDTVDKSPRQFAQCQWRTTRHNSLSWEGDGRANKPGEFGV